MSAHAEGGPQDTGRPDNVAVTAKRQQDLAYDATATAAARRRGDVTGEPACLAAAIEYAEHGWRVLPVRGKTPLLPAWSRPDGSGAASTAPDTICAWWTRWPHASVGVATGPASGLAVLDIDPRSGGIEALAALEERVGPLPGTVVNLTGGGGIHLLYAHPGRRVTSRARALGPGLDVKADGGMIVAPPSVHPHTGRRYAWLGGAWRDPLPTWPAVLLPRVERVRPAVRRPAGGDGHGDRRLAGVVQIVMDACEGERNSRLHWAGCRAAEMIAAGIDGNLVVDALQLAGEAVGLPPTEVAATIRSGMRTTAVAA